MRYIGVFLSLLVATSIVAIGGAGVVSAQSDSVTLTISVTTAEGTAVGNADLTATWDNGSTTATTTSNGKEFIDVPEGANVTITVDHEDYVRNTPYVVRDASERDISVVVAEKATATITVEDADGPVDGATVVVEMDGVTVLDAETTDGTVETGTIEEGTYDVTVSKSEYLTTERELAVSNDTRATITIERAAVPLTVNVTDDYFDPPKGVDGMTVEVEGAGSVITQSDGTQQISVPVNTKLDVEISKEGYVTVEQTVTIRESPRTIDVDIDREDALSVESSNERVVVGETVRVTVTDEYGDPVADAEIRQDDEVVARTNDEGQAVVEIQSSGEQEISVAKDDLSASVAVTGVTADGATTTPPETTTMPPTETTTASEDGGFPDIPGEYVPIVIVGAALIAVILGFRWWQAR